MALIHVIANQKGGVGKTTIAVNLAAVTHDVLATSPDHRPVLVVSTDPQGSAVWWAERYEKLREYEEERAAAEGRRPRAVEPLPFDFTQAHEDPQQLGRLRQAAQNYSHVFVDTPGSLEDAHILATVLKSADDVLVPLPPEALAYDPTARTIRQVIEPLRLPYRVVINAWDPRDGRADLDETLEYVRRQGWPLSNVVIRRYKLHTRAGADGQVVTQYPKNRTALEAREDFLRLALELNLNQMADQTGVLTAVNTAEAV